MNLFLGDLGGGPVAFNLRSATFAPGDLVARTQLLLAELPASTLALRLDLKAPTGSLSAQAPRAASTARSASPAATNSSPP